LRRTLLEMAAQYYEKVTNREPENPALRMTAARAAVKLAEIEGQLGRWEKSRAHLEQALELSSHAAVAETPDSLAVFRASARTALGLCKYQLDDLQGAHAEVEAGHHAFEALRRDHPNMKGLDYQYGTSARDLGVMNEKLARWNEAEECYRRAVEALTEHHRRVNDWESVRALATAHSNRGLGLRTHGKLAEARSELATARGLLAAFPGMEANDELLFAWQTAGNNLGAVLVGLGDLAAAERTFLEALATAEKLHRRNPSVHDFEKDVAARHANLGVVATMRRDFDAAVQHFRAASDIAEALVERNRNRSTDRSMAANMLMQLAEAKRQRRDSTAQADIDKARAHMQAALQLSPKSNSLTVELASMEQHVAVGCAAEGDFANAKAAFGRSIEALAAARANGATEFQCNNILAASYAGRANTATMQGDYAAALPDWEKAISLAPPKRLPDWGQVYATCLAKCGKYREADRQAQAILPIATPGGKWGLARAWCVAAAAAERDPTLPEAERREFVKRCTSSATAALKEAHAKGVPFEQAANHPDFAPVQAVPEFRELIESSGGASKPRDESP
jgi:tetratricopeptide (TPR) repeat protein